MTEHVINFPHPLADGRLELLKNHPQPHKDDEIYTDFYPNARGDAVLLTTMERTTHADPPEPSAEPDAEPSAEPDAEPSAEPDAEPSVEPDAEPSAEPDAEPFAEPDAEPSAEPDAQPEAEPVIIDPEDHYPI